MFNIHRMIAVGAIAGAATVAFANPASADPQKAGSIQIICGEDSYDAVVFSNGQWSPALDTNSNAVLHPVEFRNVEVRAGEFLVDTPADIARDKGKRRGVDVIECSFTQPAGPVEITGTVFGFISG